jgi:hypothetical protein
MADRGVTDAFKHIVRDGGAFRAPELQDARIVYTGDGWTLYWPNSHASITLAKGEDCDRAHVDLLVGYLLAADVPHARLRRDDGAYLYEPWKMRIFVDEINPGWGNTWRARFHGLDIKLGRLRNFRALLAELREQRIERAE